MARINFKIINSIPFYMQRYHKSTHQPRTPEVKVTKSPSQMIQIKVEYNNDDFFPLLDESNVKSYDATYIII